MKRITNGVAVLLFFVMAELLSGQSTVTSLRGTVADVSGAMVPAAQVVLENSAIGVHQSTSTDSTGQYQFAQLVPGKYTITVKAAGFASLSREAEFLVNQPATVNLVLAVEGVAATVEVSAIGLTINTSDASLGNAVSNATIQALPMEGRNVPDLLSLQPGVLYLGRQVGTALDSRSGAVSGSRSDQNNLTLDGIDNNDQGQGLAFVGVLRSTLDSVEEFRVTTSNSNADAGRSSGAQVSLVTKGGTNQMHGSAYEYHRDTATAANDWFNKRAQLSQGLPNKPGQLIRNTFGAAIGGPIKKDRLFYFLTYEGQRTAESKQSTLIVPTASLRAGNVSYRDSGGNVVTLTSSQIASMDPNCESIGSCPGGPGVNADSIALFNQYPLPNGFSSGDGLNSGSFTWSAPNPTSLNTYIAKMDYAVSDRNRLFLRANLQGDRVAAIPQFPGQPASSKTTGTTKGIAMGDSWSVGNNLINNFRYGFVRQSFSTGGIGQGAYVNFNGFSTLNPQTRNTNTLVPVHNLADDFTWVKGKHSIQFGANLRLVNNITATDANSFSSARSNPFGINDGGIANTGQSLDPAAFGFPAVKGNFGNSYNRAIMALVGLVNIVSDKYNYELDKDGSQGVLLNQGAIIHRDFANKEFEYYLQDSWRLTPHLTINFGLRHAFLQTPYEVNGQQVQPDIDINRWFTTRAEQAAAGNSVQPIFSFLASGQSRQSKPYWPMQKLNIAPRFSIAYAPEADHGLWNALFGARGKSAIRLGFGMYYDHFGQGLVSSFNKVGSFGLSSSVLSAQFFTPDNSPRFTGVNNLPQLNPPPPSTIPFPFTPPSDPLGSGFASTNGINDHISTPYSYAFNLSFQRELRGGFILEASYVGRLARHLLQQIDLGSPLNLVDPQSKTDYYTAATQLSKAGYSGATTVAPIPYWENMFPDAAGGGNSATQNIYDLWKTLLSNETLTLYSLDVLCDPGCGGKPNRYWSPEWSSLYAWSSIGTSSYNAAQLSLRRAMSNGLQFDLGYTYSKSIDMGSDAQRTCSYCGRNLAGSLVGTFSPIINSWNPKQNRSVSDFDTTHIFTANAVYSLPLGRGKAMMGKANGLTQAVIGGWQLSGLGRWTSGLPFGIFSGDNFSTDYNFQSWLVQTGPIKTKKNYSANGFPEVFANPNAITDGFIAGNPVRNAYPGETGQRNRFRGDGYFGVDLRLSKSWQIWETNTLNFAWEVFNVTNSVRFDVNPLTSLQTNVEAGQFGAYNATLTSPRVQQFSLRYSF